MSKAQEIVDAAIPSDMQRKLDDFYQQGNKIVDQFKSGLENQLPPIIYHYTTDMGLAGILESGRIWLTDIFALNDPSELRHGFYLATALLDNKTKERPPENKKFAEHFKTVLETKFEQTAYYFACSFSENWDDLGQWRAYANDGRGYALGFDTSSLEQTFCKNAKTQTSGGEAFPITYDDRKLSSIYNEIIDQIFPLISLTHGRNLQQGPLSAYRSQLKLRLAVHVLYASVYFKHNAYINEKEYRFLKIQDISDLNGIKYRLRNNELIHYKELAWKSAGPKVLKQIVIGPAADFEKSKRFAEECLRESGIDIANVKISQSQIPYKPA